MKSIKQRVFGKDSSRTIYYLVGYQTTVGLFSKHINLLVRAGFRVVAFEYDHMVIDAGEPERLHAMMNELVEAIRTDMSVHQVAGVYGISLGSFLGFNIVARTGIKRAMFNTGPANLVEVVWHAKV